MVWNQADSSAINAMFEQIPFDLLDHMHKTDPEWTDMNAFNAGSEEGMIQQDGKYVRLDFQQAGNHGLYARGGTAPWLPGFDPDGTVDDDIATPDIQQGKLYFKSHYMTVAWDATTKAAVKSQKGGYKNLVELILKDAKDNLPERIALMMSGTRYGSLAVIQAVSGTTVTVRYAGYNHPFAGSHRLRKGLVLDAVSGSSNAYTGALEAGRGIKITSVPLDTGTSGTGPQITISQADPSGWGAGDILIPYNSRPQTAALTTAAHHGDAPKESAGCAQMTGLLDVIDDGGFQPFYATLSRTSYPSLNSFVLDNSGTARALTLDLVNEGSHRCNQISGGGNHMIYTRPDCVREMMKGLTKLASTDMSHDNPIRWSPSNTQQVGFSKVTIVPLGANQAMAQLLSRNAPAHTALLIDKSSMVMLYDGPPKMQNEDGSDFRYERGKDQLTGFWRFDAAGWFSKAPWKNVRIEDVAGSHMEA